MIQELEYYLDKKKIIRKELLHFIRLTIFNNRYLTIVYFNYYKLRNITSKRGN